MNTVTIGGKAYPTRIDFGAVRSITRTLGYQYITDMTTVMDRFQADGTTDVEPLPLDSLATIMRAIIAGGLRGEGIDITAETLPDLDAIDLALDGGELAFGEAFTAAATDTLDRTDQAAKTTQGKPKRVKTRKV